MTPSWVIRDDVPAQDCDCLAALLDGRHGERCASLRHHGPYYYAGRDLEGNWYMPGLENAARFSYRDAQRIARGLNKNHPRKVVLERVERASAAVAA